MGLKAHTHLHDLPAQDDDAQGLDDGEDEVGQVVDNGKRVTASGGKGRDGQRGADGQDQNGGEVEAAGPVPPPELLAGEICAWMGTMGKVVLHIQYSSVSSKTSISSRDVKVKSRSSAP